MATETIQSDDDLFVGVDCGTQSTKALVMRADGVAVGAGQASHPLIQTPAGAREQDPEWWIEAFRVAAKLALKGLDASRVRGIGVSGQQHGLVVLDEQHRVLRHAKLWNDTETTPENAELIERLGGEQACLNRFGIIPRTGYTVSKLLWLKRYEREVFDQVRHILLPHEYLNFWLTGRFTGEPGDASGTGYFDPRTRAWATDVLDEIDDGAGLLTRALPQLIQPGELAGMVRPDIAKEFGIAPDCIVSSGGGDNMMGAIGTGNVADRIVTLSLGTSATVYAHSHGPSSDRSGCVAPFCASTDGWLPLVCTMNATNVVTQTLNMLGKTVADIETALASTLPGASGITFVPFLHGERTPDLPTATGSMVGLSANNFSVENLIRAVVEGVTFGILEGLDLIVRDQAYRRIRAIGGGARSDAWMQLVADCTGAQIDLVAQEEAASLGAAIQALFAYLKSHGGAESIADICRRCVHLDQTRVFQPNLSARPSYDAARQRYREEVQRLYTV